MSRADAKHNVHLLHDYPVKAHAWSVTAEDKSVLLWEGFVCCKLSQCCVHWKLKEAVGSITSLKRS